MRFKEAVESVDEISDAYRKGLQAIPQRDRKRMECRNSRMLAGSIHLENAVKERRLNEPLWDYGVGIRRQGKSDCVVWIEVHPASTSNVREMTAKIHWLRNWLKNKAPILQTMTRPERAFIWIASGGIQISKNTPQFRRIAQAGLMAPRKHLVLDDFQ